MSEMNHVDLYPYPTFAQAQPSFGEALKIVTGQSELDMACKAKTLHTVASFALGVGLPHHPEVFSTDDKDAQALLAWADAGSDGVRGIGPWAILAVKLLQFILSNLPLNQ